MVQHFQLCHHFRRLRPLRQVNIQYKNTNLNLSTTDSGTLRSNLCVVYIQKSSSSLPYTPHFPANQTPEEINGHFVAICQTFPSLHTTPLPSSHHSGGGSSQKKLIFKTQSTTLTDQSIYAPRIRNTLYHTNS